MSNRVCSLFDIEYPFIMGAVASQPALGIAVSKAGGLGCIAAGTVSPDQLRDRIRAFRDATDRPFAVNLPIVLTPADQAGPKLEVMAEEHVPIVITSAGNPKLWTAYLKERGIRVAHVLPTTYHATKAVEAGVDAIIAEPVESGGYRGENDVSMMVLIPSIRRAFPGVPLVAAGAVADGHGLAAVFALGAEGVQLGTRLMASAESEVHPSVLKLILAAEDTSTASAEGRVRPRIARPDFAERVLGESRRAQMGQVAALINDVPPVGQIIHGMFREAREVALATAAALAEGK